MIRRMLLLAVLSGLALAGPALADQLIAGTKYRVVDGDTIHIGEHKIRLIGIDAPERNQRCRNGEGRSWPCGREATAMLKGLLDSSEAGVSCAIEGKDRYGRLLGVCFAGTERTGIDVQRELVLSGMAVAEYDARYRSYERRAESAQRGIWAGEFLRPKEWRARKGR